MGLVPSGVVTTLIQIFSRVLLAAIVVPAVADAQKHWMVTTMVQILDIYIIIPLDILKKYRYLFTQ